MEISKRWLGSKVYRRMTDRNNRLFAIVAVIAVMTIWDAPTLLQSVQRKSFRLYRDYGFH
ncbi:hypothetical protein LB565_27695 [Mesorhizobium sp. CA14]|uniref:hypothetical protein n=1 Tax=Mesorhizobium sp. CA14 TaxID=2876642 RepID=UPI001CCD4049|nr:hypothetical protein [Mesorhizobium sp. CA14]MBZ9851776.1 hypothetical protein [Mesorhizobium sp. CA14]